MPRNSGRTTKPFSASTSSTSKPKSKPRQKADGEAYTFIPSLPKRHRTSEQTLSLSREEAGPSRRRTRRDEGDDDEDSDEGMAARVRKVAMLIAQDDLAEMDDSESSVASDDAWEEEGSDEERWGDVFRDLNKGKGKGKRKVEVARKAAIPLNVNLDESDDEPTVKGKGKAKAVPTKSAPKVVPIPDDRSDEELSGGSDDDGSDELDSNLDDADLSPNEFEGGEDDGDESEDEILEGFANGHDDTSGSGDQDEDNDDDEEGDEEDEDEDDDTELPSDLSGDENLDDLDPTSLDGLDAFVDRLTESSKKRDAPTDVSGVEKKRRVPESIPAPALDGNDLGLKSRTKVDLASLIASHPSLSSASALLPKAKSKSSKPTSILKQGTLPAPLPTSVQDRLNREAAYEATKEEGAKWAGVMKRIKEAEHLSFPLQATERGGVKSSGEMLSEYKPRQGLESAVQALLAKANLTEDGITKRENEALEGQELSLEEMEERRKRLREQRELMFRAEARAKRVAKIKSKTFRKLARKRAAKAGMDEEVELDEDAREKAEMERARERATLKHGARTSRWARHADQMGVDEGRMAKEEMLDIKQRLSKKIQGQGESDSEESEESDEEGDEGIVKDMAFDQLSKVQAAPEEGQDEGLMGMAFMKKARERQMQKAREEEEGLKRDIEMFGDFDNDSGSEGQDGEEGAMMNVGGTGGRMVFSGATACQAPKRPIPVPTPAEALTNGHAARKEVHFDAPATTEPAGNPWLAQTSSSGPSRKRQHGITADSSAADKAVKSLKKAAQDTTAQEEDGRVEITLDPEAVLGAEDDEGMGTMPRKRVKLGQRDLIAEAFAGDNVVEDFAAEKARVVAEDAPQVEDTTLPGWGSWAGKGLKKRKPHPSRLVVKPGIDPSTRADAVRDNVIISEKKDKKASKYLVKDLPYPYTSKAQYEKRFENPLGAEWNSRAGHQRETLPRVMKKPGAIIEPVRRLF